MFKVGDRVVVQWDKYNHNDPDLSRGKIVTESVRDPLTGKDKIYVKWDSKWRSPDPSEVFVESLLSESEANEKISVLEHEFKIIESEIESKMGDAAFLIREASKLAKKAGIESLQDMYEATRKLYSAMDSAGWNTSSFGC